VLVGVSDLRANFPKYRKSLKEKKQLIVLIKGKPEAVIEDYETFQVKDKMLEQMEDIILGYMALERLDGVDEASLISLDEVKKLYG